jgi:hypothetical protein
VDLVPDHYDPKTFPVDAVARGRQAQLQGRMFNNFIWGGYLLQAWPEQRVFIDGGTDHYGETLFNQWIQVWNLEPGWRDVLARWHITLALVQPTSRLADELVRDQRWQVWYCDSTAVILRNPASAAATDTRSAHSAGCPLGGPRMP